MPDEIFIQADVSDTGARADVFVAEKLSGYSRSAVRHLIDDGRVTINGTAVKSNYRVRGEERFEILLPEPVATEMTPEDIPLAIVYEDADVIVIDKPQGMVVHPAAGNYSGTVANALVMHCGESLSGINGVLRPGIVHRIDKDTSGLIVAAKNDAAHKSLSAQLQAHTVERVYYALCCGVMKKDSGTIDRPLGRYPKDRKKITVVKSGGKHAVTHYKVLERFKKFTFAEVKLETGRTHQIRAHMASVGHPLFGDTVYSGKTFPDIIKGQALHAGVLGFTHPRTNEEVRFESPLPDYFQNILFVLR